jgi:hypothetical protein
MAERDDFPLMDADDQPMFNWDYDKMDVTNHHQCSDCLVADESLANAIARTQNTTHASEAAMLDAPTAPTMPREGRRRSHYLFKVILIHFQVHSVLSAVLHI